MSSPFPGMDPYLEGYLWTDVHQRLATEISRRLTPHIRPRYVARLAVTNYVDYDPSPEIGIIYPDIEVLKRRSQAIPEPTVPVLGGGIVAEPPVTDAIDVPAPVFNVRAVSVEVYDAAENQLVTGIEILSPVNKRQPDLDKFREKYSQLRNGDVHVIVIDLLRRGQRPIGSSALTESPYLITLTRSGAQVMNAWPIQLDEKLPVVPVPLRQPDPDVHLDLSAAFSTVYEEAAYDLSIDYSSSPPPPAMSDIQIAKMKQIL